MSDSSERPISPEDDPSLWMPPDMSDSLDDDDITYLKPPSTHLLQRSPTLIERAESVLSTITPSTVLVLQILPSGQVITLDLNSTLVLGRRGTRADNFENPGIDLTSLHARQHGVSRLHCALTRDTRCFTVTDLSSTNGTYLNDERLPPETPYPLTDGDLLVLGTLHILVTMNELARPDAQE